MRILIIDDSPDFSTLLRRVLARAFPDVEVTEYDPEQSGVPDSGFDWSLYDLLLLDHDLGSGETGIAWLARFRDRPGFPPTVLCTMNEDPYVAVKAMKLGARNYINKADLSPARLREIAAEILAGVESDSTASEADIASVFARPPGGTRVMRTASGGGYRFVRLIGQGAFSRVYLAERNDDGTTMVLKILDGTAQRSRQTVQRFVQEAELVAGIESPYVVRIHEQGFTNNYGYIAMEFFSRGDLKQRIEHGLSVNEALGCLAGIARGLAAIHEVGIVHRDLKPGNIMFRADGGLAIADFGISKRLGSTLDLTTTGELLGTPNYMSPEQIQAHATDARSDLYSAGIIFYELLTGAKPFNAGNAASLLFAHLSAPVPRLPADLARFQPVVDRLLAKSPDERFPSAEALLGALEDLATHA